MVQKKSKITKKSNTHERCEKTEIGKKHIVENTNRWNSEHRVNVVLYYIQYITVQWESTLSFRSISLSLSPSMWTKTYEKHICRPFNNNIRDCSHCTMSMNSTHITLCSLCTQFSFAQLCSPPSYLWFFFLLSNSFSFSHSFIFNRPFFVHNFSMSTFYRTIDTTQELKLAKWLSLALKCKWSQLTWSVAFVDSLCLHCVIK